MSEQTMDGTMDGTPWSPARGCDCGPVHVSRCPAHVAEVAPAALPCGHHTACRYVTGAGYVRCHRCDTIAPAPPAVAAEKPPCAVCGDGPHPGYVAPAPSQPEPAGKSACAMLDEVIRGKPGGGPIQLVLRLTPEQACATLQKIARQHGNEVVISPTLLPVEQAMRCPPQPPPPAPGADEMSDSVVTALLGLIAPQRGEDADDRYSREGAIRELLAGLARLRASRDAERAEAAKWRRELSAACELAERSRKIVIDALNQPPEYWYDKHDNGEWSAEHAAHAIRELFDSNAWKLKTLDQALRERDEAREQRDKETGRRARAEQERQQAATERNAWERRFGNLVARWDRDGGHRMAKDGDPDATLARVDAEIADSRNDEVGNDYALRADLAAATARAEEAERTLTDALANPAKHTIDNCTTWRAMNQMRCQLESEKASAVYHNYGRGDRVTQEEFNQIAARADTADEKYARRGTVLTEAQEELAECVARLAAAEAEVRRVREAAAKVIATTATWVDCNDGSNGRRMVTAVEDMRDLLAAKAEGE